jgi:hypothetical protein
LREVLNQLRREVAQCQLEPLEAVGLGDAIAEGLPADPARIQQLEVKCLDLAKLQVAA